MPEKKEAKAVGNKKEKHRSPNTLASVDPTAQLLNITLAGKTARCLPGLCPDRRYGSEELPFLALLPQGRKTLEAKRLE